MVPNEAARHADVWGSGGIAPVILISALDGGGCSDSRPWHFALQCYACKCGGRHSDPCTESISWCLVRRRYSNLPAALSLWQSILSCLERYHDNRQNKQTKKGRHCALSTLRCSPCIK
jgi:hypothetical protein